MKRDITDYLFETKAFVPAAAERPFWYTSGLFGPYYINTHYLFGSKEAAEQLLERIETACLTENRSRIDRLVGDETAAQYERNAIYRDVIDTLAELVSDKHVQYVSGGERRDYFFSIEVARRLGLPHIYIFKDGDARLADPAAGTCIKPASLTGNVLHVADLITKASSYERAWLPALHAIGLTMTETVAGVDRAQGGIGILAEHGVHAQALISIDDHLFEEANRRGKITAEQRTQLSRYAANEMQFVRAFLAGHPGFLEAEAARDEKTRERTARLQAILERESEYTHEK